MNSGCAEVAELPTGGLRRGRLLRRARSGAVSGRRALLELREEGELDETGREGAKDVESKAKESYVPLFLYIFAIRSS